MAQYSPAVAAYHCLDRMHAEDQYILRIDLFLQVCSSGSSASCSSNSSTSAAACESLSSPTERLVDQADILEDVEDEDMEISMAAADTLQHTSQGLCEQADTSSMAPLSQQAPVGAHLDNLDVTDGRGGALTDEEESDLSAAATPRQRRSGHHRRARSSGSPSEDNLSMTGLMDSDSEAASNASLSGCIVRISLVPMLSC